MNGQDEEARIHMMEHNGNLKLLPVQTAYDLWADEYDDADPTTALDQPFMASMLEPFDGCRILDLGCGTGRYLRQIAGPNVQLVGLDLSRAMLARAKRTMPLVSPVRFVQASIEQLPFTPSSFDRVVAGLVLDHIHDLRLFFRETAVILRPGGRLLISAVHPDMQYLTGSAVRFTTKGQEYATPGTRHTVHSIQTAARRAGLTPECLQEPRIDPAFISRYPTWSERVGYSALVLFVARKSLHISR
jgi:malonyl-CoA O-methyltransferase